MARVLLTTLYDEHAQGLRIMAACLVQAGHDVCLLFLESEADLLRQWGEGDSVSSLDYMLVLHHGSILRFSAPLSSITEPSWALYTEQVQRFSPHVIGCSSRSQYDEDAPSFLRRLRRMQPEALLVCGGFGPTFHPAAYLKEADLVVCGEGEETIVDLARALDRGDGYHGIPNLCYEDSGRIERNPLRPPLHDLDALPFPLYGIEDAMLIRQGAIVSEPRDKYVVLAGRGCLGTCSYCAGGNWPKLYARNGHVQPKRRLRSLDRVIEELVAARRMEYRYVHFADEHLAAPPGQLVDFFREYERRVALPFNCNLHIGLIVKHPEIVQAAADAGLVFSGLGIQSGSEGFSRRVYNRPNNNEEILQAARQLQSAGVGARYHVILGNPLESRADVEETFELVKRLPSSSDLESRTVVYRFTPLPGSPILENFASPADARAPDEVFIRDALLCQLRRHLEDEEFAECQQSTLFQEHPLALQALLRYFTVKTVAEQHTRHLHEMAGKTVAVWGTGGRWQEVVAPLLRGLPRAVAIDCFVDSNPERQGSRLEGRPVLAPSALAHRPVEAVLIATCFVNDVVRALCRLGLNNLPRYAF